MDDLLLSGSAAHVAELNRLGDGSRQAGLDQTLVARRARKLLRDLVIPNTFPVAATHIPKLKFRAARAAYDSVRPYCVKSFSIFPAFPARRCIESATDLFRLGQNRTD